VDIARIGANRFVEGDVPVIVERAFTPPPWSREYLSARIGAAPAKWKVSPNGAFPNFWAGSLKEMFATQSGTFADFFADLSGKLFTGDEKFVLRRRGGVTTLDPDLAVLLEDVPVPALVPADRLYTVWSWFSGAGVRTWLHYDNNGCHNLNAQVTGAKRCVLYSPDQLDAMALFPRGGSNPALNCSQIDVAHPDLTRFPEFARARGLTARLGPGDMLYIPAWWLHAFEHDGDFNSNVNFWWKPVAPVDNAVARHQAAIETAVTP
jgi:hypothetical protein